MGPRRENRIERKQWCKRRDKNSEKNNNKKMKEMGKKVRHSQKERREE